MLINLHPLNYFRAKAFLCWLLKHMPGQAHFTNEAQEGLEKRWGPLRIRLYRRVRPDSSEYESCDLSVGPLHFMFELEDDPEFNTAFTLWVTT